MAVHTSAISYSATGPVYNIFRLISGVGRNISRGGGGGGAVVNGGLQKRFLYILIVVLFFVRKIVGKTQFSYLPRSTFQYKQYIIIS